MLQSISEIIKNIAIIILLTVFIEMLLPNNDMKRYVQLVMGLFIIVTIITPIITFLDKDEVLEASLWKFSETKGDVESVLKNGEEIRNLSREKALEEYRYRVQKQIEALARLVPGVSNVEVSVVLENKDILQYESISKVELWVVPYREQSKKSSDIKIEPVRIPDEREAEIRENVAEGIRDTIANFYGLNANQITVHWR